ncbi:hypothetical protein CSUI_001796 [Cystoisospora suis]|uniref:Uncharacterized protein n=1 Tax=Cystoisospora suis TaxID=483139 RepID=A0A2C6KJX6_9APIC|nr:hypothetical protein CSUI_001796 [Cystoisospora suis]
MVQKMEAFAKVGAALVATSYLVHSFCPVYISATEDSLEVRQSADGTTSTGRSWDNPFEREAKRSPQGLADEERSSNGVEGESKRRSPLYRRSSSGLFSNQSGTLQKLLTAALLSVGMFSAVRMGKELMSGPPRGDEDAVRSRRTAPVAGLPSRSLPNSLVIAGLTLLVVASSLATPLRSEHRGRRSEDEEPGESETISDASRTVGFFHRGAYFKLEFSEEEVTRYNIKPEDIKELEDAFNGSPREVRNEAEGVMECFWGKPTEPTSSDPKLMGFFHLPDGRQNYLTVPSSVYDCTSCRQKIYDLGEKVGEYELKLTASRVEELGKVSNRGGDLQVVYELNEGGRPECFIGYGTPGDAEEEDADVVRFSLGDTDFVILLSHTAREALEGRAGTRNLVGSLDPTRELLGNLMGELTLPPTMKALTWGPPGEPARFELRGDMGVLRKPRRPSAELQWGHGENKVTFETQLTRYSVGLPHHVQLVMRRADNNAWPLLRELLRVAFPHLHAAFVRGGMTTH